MGCNNVSVLIGNGDGTFKLPTNTASGSAPGGLAVGGISGDPNLDVVTANSAMNNVSYLQGSANGTLAAATPFAAGQQPASVDLQI